MCRQRQALCQRRYHCNNFQVCIFTTDLWLAISALTPHHSTITSCAKYLPILLKAGDKHLSLPSFISKSILTTKPTVEQITDAD